MDIKIKEYYLWNLILYNQTDEQLLITERHKITYDCKNRLVHHFTAIEGKEILDKIYEDFMNDDCITTILNNDFQDIINYYLSK